MSLKTLKTSTTGLDFRLGDELDQLSRRARIVAAEGVAEHGRFHDSWINGHSKEFSHDLG